MLGAKCQKRKKEPLKLRLTTKEQELPLVWTEYELR